MVQAIELAHLLPGDAMAGHERLGLLPGHLAFVGIGVARATEDQEFHDLREVRRLRRGRQREQRRRRLGLSLRPWLPPLLMLRRRRRRREGNITLCFL